MTPQRPQSPRAYLRSQKDRAARAAKDTGGTAGELLQLHFHRRLLARVFHGSDAKNWVLKGGQAMLVRWPSARYSADIDLLSAEDNTDAAVEALKTIAALRLDDGIWFAHLSTSDQTHVDRPTRKVTFMAMFENAPLHHRVPVDVVAAGHMPRGPIALEPLKPVFKTDSTPWPDARVFPVEDHVAEKICAMYELYRADARPSTRYKDLVDLALFACNTRLDGAEMHRILRDEVDRRRKRGMVLELPEAFRAPDPHSWAAGYRKAASDVRELADELRTLEGVTPLADAFITPLLRAEPPLGHWNPAEQRWR
ncbi:nucleotidyl transferase AbiEii/AbiGii toxin family protein [Amycolatopsis sp. NPDC058986]|uniref:nucleotidyl transferase AbiEii/AbiGii toxin family protein n=1 Tax=unclassified Amycolatopsis TaxID=2618356 RepID=UPI003671FDFA